MAERDAAEERDRAGAALARGPRVAYVALLLLVLGFFLYSIEPVLSPIVLFAVLLLLLSPYSGTRAHMLMIVALGSLTLLWLLAATGSLLAPFVLAFVLAYILNPAVRWLVARRVPRGLAALLPMLPVIALVVFAVIVGVPMLVRQIGELLEHAPEAVARFGTWAEQMRLRLMRMDLPFIDEQRLFRSGGGFDAQRLPQVLEQRQEQILQWLWGAVLGVRRGVGIVFSILGFVVLTPVLLFYLLRDYEGITEKLKALIPTPKRERWLAFLGEYDNLLSRYLRGQLAEAALVGVLTWLGLLVLGFPYPGLLGAIAGVFNVVPYLGLLASVVPGILIALLSGDPGTNLLKLAGVFAVVQFLDASVTGPRIVGGSVGLHPVWILLALAVGGSFFGFVGLLIAVPVAVLFKLVLRNLIARWQASPSFTAETVDH